MDIFDAASAFVLVGAGLLLITGVACCILDQLKGQ